MHIFFVKVVWFLGRMVLGGIFIWSGIVKIIEPADQFESAIAAYQIVPEFILPVMALILPWVELIFGVFVVLGWMFRFSVGVLIFLLIVFMIAVGSTVAAGISLDGCGCFGSSFSLGDDPWDVIWKDAALLGIGLMLFKFRVRVLCLDSLFS